MEHKIEIKEFSGITNKVYEVECSCGFRGPSIKTHWYLDKLSAESEKEWHLANPEKEATTI